MKQKVLFMTVGTGFGEEGKISLAHALTHSIIENTPQKVIFFGSTESKQTVKLIKEDYHNQESEELKEYEDYEFVELEEPDDFNSCYEIMNEYISKYENDKRLLDYTSGTKTMSVTIATIGIVNNLSLSLIKGRRGENGIVIANTEEINAVNAYQVYDKQHFQNVKKYFNYYKYQSANDSLSEITTLLDNEEKKYMNQLIELYDDWDKFIHPDVKLPTEHPLVEHLSEQLKKNVKALRIINKENHKQKCFYILADLINNAKRRCEEEKYDDAVARLYRSLELIAQIRLQQEYGQKTKDIDVNKLKNYKLDKKYMMELEDRASRGSILFGVTEDYRLLNELDDDLGRKYYQKEKIYQNNLKERNQSILAHGIKSTSKERYLEFEELVLELAEDLTPQIELYMEETKFPKFPE